MAEKLNVLLITSDMQRGDCFGFEGRKVKTPHLDGMTRDGARFSACITPNVVCQPTRACRLLMEMNIHLVTENLGRLLISNLNEI